MPIYARSYERLERERTSRATRVLALSRAIVSGLLARRVFLALLAASWIPAIVRAVQIYVSHQFPQARDFVSLSASTWLDFLTGQVWLMPVVLVSLYVGAGAIATDLASGAYVLYVSKPISRIDYVLGRALPVLAAVSFVTLVPGLALLGLELGIAPDFGVLRETPWLPFAITGYSLWLASYFTVIVLAVSSLSRSGRVSGVGFAALVLGSETVFKGALARMGLGGASRLGVLTAAIDSGNIFFGEGSSSVFSLVVMAAGMAVAIFVLTKRLHSADVVR